MPEMRQSALDLRVADGRRLNGRFCEFSCGHCQKSFCTAKYRSVSFPRRSVGTSGIANPSPENIMSSEARLAEKLSELKLLLPPPAEPKGVYKPLVTVGNLVYTSGHLPVRSDGTLVTGRVGAELDVHAGYQAAQLVGLGILSTLRKQFASLDNVRRLVKLLGRGQLHARLQPAAGGHQWRERVVRGRVWPRSRRRRPQRHRHEHAPLRRAGRDRSDF